MHRQLRESLSERLRSEVQVSAALWQIKHNDDKVSSGDTKGGANGNSQRSVANTNVKSAEDGFPCPREVKPLLFFYKYLQPIGGSESVGGSDDSNLSGPTNSSSQRKLRVNLPLTVVCERSNAQEMVLWLRTDAQGNVIRDEKTPLWRKKLHNELLGATAGFVASPPDSQESDPVLAVRSVARWKNTNKSSGGSAVVLTRKTLDPVLAIPCELPICIQQFVHCRGSQASVYRVFWCEQERKCFAVNLTSSLKSTEAPEDAEALNNLNAPITTTSMSGVSASTMAAMNAAFEAAMVTAAQTARFYCVTVSPDARACARWPKLRGAAISEGVQATSRIVEHVQTQLPTLRFHSMTVDFIKDTSGVWWLTRVVDFNASSTVEPIRDEGGFGTRDSAVLISEALRARDSRTNNEPQLDDPESPPRESTHLRGDEFNNALNARICFLCGCSCELKPTFRGQLKAMLNADSGDEFRETSVISMEAPAIDEFRMTLTMALDTIYLMRQRGVGLPAWENAVSTVRKSQVRDVCDFPTCMLCYRIYQQQNKLQVIARELHNALSPNALYSDEDTEVVKDFTTGGISVATSAVSGLTASQLLSTELQYREETPKSVLEALDAFRAETIPPSLLLRGGSPESRPTWSILSPVRGADVDPTATQLRLVFFFHELQDGGPDLEPTDFFLEYQLGQNVTRVHLEGSKRHTPNRWQLCEARVHYLCATLDAFNEFCLHKRLLIKLKAKPRSQRERSESDELEDDENAASNADGFDNSGSPTSDTSRFRDKEEFFGYTLLPLRTVNTAAKWFGNSLQPESRSDYLLEVHTASYGLLTLKLTVGLLVDPVPLGNVRDVLRDRIFLEEQQPRGVYWPPTTHCLGGLAVPRDWVGALMPSEYTKILPMRRRGAYGARPLTPSRSSRSPSQTTLPLTRRNSAVVVETAAATSNEKSDQGSITRKMSNMTMTKDWTEASVELAYTVDDGSDHAAGANTDQEKPEYHKSRSLRLTMNGTTLSRACMAAKRIVFRITEDTETKNFPTLLLAQILRHANFVNPVSTLSNWKSPARFQFTRRYTVDHLLAEVKPDNLPMLGLLGELLHVLIEHHALPTRVDASALELVLEPFWQQDSGWRSIPRTRTCCLPERRVIWNRAIRRWVAGTDSNTIVDEIAEPARQPDGNVEPIMPHYGCTLATVIGEFRAKTLAVVLCELFEKMETLDNEYIEIAELRSLAKCLPDEKYLCGEEQLDPEVNMRERLTQNTLVVLSELVDQQRRLTLRSLLHSLVRSTVMMDALARFDRVGSSEMSLEEFRELAAEALLSQRKAFCAFPEEPTKSHDGFCIRHGFTEIYATDSVCVLCAVEYQVKVPPSEHLKSPENSPENHESITTSTTVHGAQRFNEKDILSGRSTDTDFHAEGMQHLERENIRSVSSAPTLDKLRRISSSKTGLEEPTEVDTNSGSRRRRAIGGRKATSRQKVDTELEAVLNQLHAAERIAVVGEAQLSERKASVASIRTRQSSVSTTSEPRTSFCSIGNLPRNTSKRSSVGTVLSQIGSQEDAPADVDKVAKMKKPLKKKKLKKAAQRTRLTNSLPQSASLSKLLRIELSDRRRFLSTSASETVIEKAVRIEEKRKQLDRLVLAEVQEVKQRLAKLLDEA